MKFPIALLVCVMSGIIVGFLLQGYEPFMPVYSAVLIAAFCGSVATIIMLCGRS